jgi:putative spermidine/putrescine transport system ATP-binding protein
MHPMTVQEGVTLGCGESGEGSGRPILVLRNLVKRYAGVTAVSGVSLEVAGGDFVALLGPSGCGKTTVLRSIAGIVEPDEGEILLHGKSLVGRPIHARGTALVFQNYALFPHLSVFENIAFGLRMRRVARSELQHRVDEALSLVRLGALAKRLPGELSGGQQQRVALARALVIRPSLLLLDEPLSNLDARLREEMRSEVRRLQRELGVTTVLVTHDIEEAFAVADLIAVMHEGRIVQTGTPSEIYGAPASRFVAEFVGHANLFEADTAVDYGPDVILRFGDVATRATKGPDAILSGRFWVVVPPERIRLGAAADGLANRYEAVIEEITYFGGTSEVALRLGASRFVAVTQNLGGETWSTGKRIAIGWEPGDVIARPLT